MKMSTETSNLEDPHEEIHQGNDEEKLVDTNYDKHQPTVKFKQCRGCTFYMEPLLFIYMLSSYPYSIILPQYILGRELTKLTGNNNISVNTNSCVGDPGHNSTVSNNHDPIKGNFTEAQSAASLFMLQSSLVSSIPAILVVIFLGPYSDKRGRKIALIPPIVGSVISNLNTLLNAYFQWPIEMILVGNFLSGCTGSQVTLFMGAYAFTADISTKEERQFRMVLVETVPYSSSIISTAASGYLLDSMGFTLVFLLMFALNVAILFYAIFIIPESVEPDPEARFFSVEYLAKSVTVFAVDDQTKRRWKLLLLLAALFLSNLFGSGGSVRTLFMTNYPLCWGPELVGIFLSVGLAVGVVGSAVTSKIFSCFLRDAWIAVVSGIISVARYIYMFFVTTTAMMFGSVAFKLTDLLIPSTIRAMLSKTVQPGEVGAVLGGAAFVEGLRGFLSDPILNPIYSATQAMGMPSLAFLVMCGVYTMGLILMIIYAVLTRHGNHNKQKSYISTSA